MTSSSPKEPMIRWIDFHGDPDCFVEYSALTELQRELSTMDSALIAKNEEIVRLIEENEKVAQHHDDDNAVNFRLIEFLEAKLAIATQAIEYFSGSADEQTSLVAFETLSKLKEGEIAERDGKDYPELKAKLAIAVEALQFYSTAPDCVVEGQIEWRPHVCDSYSGQQYAPDWDGSLQDKPNEIASEALSKIKGVVG